MSSKDVGTLRTRLSWEDEGSTRGLKGFKDDLKGLRSEMNAARSQGREYTTSLRGLREQSDILTRRLSVQKREVTELRRRYEESKRVKGEDAQQTKNLSNQYNNAVAAMNRTENQLKGVTNAIKEQVDPWRRLSRSAEETGRTMQAVGSSISSFGRSYTMRVTTPILGAGAAALKVGMDFEEGMSKVQALTQASENDMKRLSDQAKELGSTTRYSATQAADAMSFLGMAGWETQEIMQGMPGLLSLAASANMELGRAADITSNIMSAFNIEASKAGQVADILAHAASNANTDVNQLGEAMTYLAPVANTLGISIEDATAAMMGAADAGLQGSMGGRAFATSLTRLASPTAAMEKEMKRLKLSFFDADGAMKPLPDIIENIETATAGMDEKTRAATLSTLFGAEAQKHWAVLLDQGSKALRDNSKELENSEGAAKRMADIMSDNAKGALTEFRSALEGAGIALSEHMIPAFTNIVQKGTELIRKFGELDDETQKQIVKWGLMVAAVGPAAIVLGNLTTALGGVLRIVSLVSGAIAAKGGLVAALGMLSNPVTATIAGVGLLAGGIYLLNQRSERAVEVNLETAKSLIEQHAALEEATSAYESLRRQSNLTTEEFGRFMDIQDRINKAVSESEIEALQAELEELRKKSGLSNEELDKMVGLNNSLIEKVPEAAGHISEQGNRIVDTTGYLREYNEELANATLRELERQKIIAEGNERQLKQEIVELQEQLNEGLEKEEIYREQLRGFDEEASIARIEEINQMLEKEGIRGRERQLLLGELKNEENKLSLYRDQLTEQMKKNDETRETIEQKEKELGLAGEIRDMMVEQMLKQVGVNAEKDNAISAINQAIEKEEEHIRKMEDLKGAQGEMNMEVQEEIARRQENIRQLENTKREIININGAQDGVTDAIYESYLEAQKLDRSLSISDYLKTVNVTDRGTIADLERRAAREITKTVFVKPNFTRHNSQPFAYAEGTDYHPGGPAIVGEEGPELAKLGNRWTMLDFGMVDLPRGTQVFTNDETKRILNSLNRLPAYATGISRTGEADRVVRQLNGEGLEREAEPIVLQINLTNTMDGRVVGQVVEEHVTEIQSRNKRVRERFA
ncbi:phage tail tape measure protein [Alkalihalobacterium alkalinitrilicum]|uniref:phage tail tape measure protein n=1 Tax=Alkalihalobacterium alkalinitrilicum TaxID=427920 RepID=UPI000994F04F|nr:phage tail tape measure protein [Alkalihalobacterium alkalinitrilicum]